MKKIAVFIIICFHSILSSAQQINEPYGFTVKPGSNEWSKLKIEKERFDAMQIPENILTRMNTEALIISCINFPAFGYFGAYDNYQTGFTILATKFNGLRELAKRTDAGICLQKIYKYVDLTGKEIQYLKIDTKYWPIRLSWIELLLSQNLIIESLNVNEKKVLLSISLEKFKMKQQSKEHSPDGLLTTALLMGRVLNSLNYELFVTEINKNETLKNFLSTSDVTYSIAMDLIVKYTQDFLNTK